jgi:hypothetical protein
LNNEVYSFALKSTLTEIQNVCPTVSNSFIFKDGKILVKDETTTKKNINQTIDAFQAITKKAKPIGGLETITIQGANGRVNIVDINDFHLATISSKETDEKYVNTLTRVLIPIVIKLVEKINPASTDDKPLKTVYPEPVEDDATEDVVDNAEGGDNDLPVEETKTSELSEEQEQFKPEVDPELLLPEPPVTQLIVENLNGLLAKRSDSVRIDNEIVAQWRDLYGDKEIKEVDVEALNGKTTRCKVKKIKKSKDAGKGIIKIPEKIQLTLETTKGELITVKPVVE